MSMRGRPHFYDKKSGYVQFVSRRSRAARFPRLGRTRWEGLRVEIAVVHIGSWCLDRKSEFVVMAIITKF